jgi:glycosyltransferase involved in cell wall biosynthesis
MGYGNCVLALAAPENVEVVGEAGIPYRDVDELAEQLRRVLRDASLVAAYRQRAQDRVRQFYNWEGVVDRYENLFADLAAGRRHQPDSFLEALQREDETQAESVKVNSGN